MNKIFRDLLAKVPLETRIKVALQFADEKNWDNGTYKGDKELIDKQTKLVIKALERKSDIQCWEIYVPVRDSKKNKYTKQFHREWDIKVKNITGGLSILKPLKGKWKSKYGTVFIEKMIPVRISCTRDQIDQITEITLNHYNQLSVFAYKISDEVIFKEGNYKEDFLKKFKEDTVLEVK